MELRVKGPLPIGTRLSLDDQGYELVELRPMRRADGAMTNLFVWRTDCPECCGSFECVTAGVSKAPSRRCGECRQPQGGRPIGKPFKRVAAVLYLPVSA